MDSDISEKISGNQRDKKEQRIERNDRGKA